MDRAKDHVIRVRVAVKVSPRGVERQDLQVAPPEEAGHLFFGSYLQPIGG